MAEDILRTLTYDQAKTFIGRTYTVDVGSRTIELTVVDVRRSERPRVAPMKRDTFSIFFRGPLEAALPQHMYNLVGETSLPGIFLVPISRNEKGYEYEAVFT